MSNALSYGDKKILTVYKHFYDEEYDGDSKNKDNWITHLKAQKMVYLLSSVGIYFGDIGFSWHTNGPFSAELQYNLKSLDQNRQRVLKFYQSEDYILQEPQLAFIKKIKSITVDKRPKDCAVYTWLELLASIFFIKKFVLPFETKDMVNAEVKKRNETLMENTPVDNAWSALTEFEKQAHYI